MDEWILDYDFERSSSSLSSTASSTVSRHLTRVRGQAPDPLPFGPQPRPRPRMGFEEAFTLCAPFLVDWRLRCVVYSSFMEILNERRAGWRGEKREAIAIHRTRSSKFDVKFAMKCIDWIDLAVRVAEELELERQLFLAENERRKAAKRSIFEKISDPNSLVKVWQSLPFTNAGKAGVHRQSNVIRCPRCHPVTPQSIKKTKAAAPASSRSWMRYFAGCATVKKDKGKRPAIAIFPIAAPTDLDDIARFPSSSYDIRLCDLCIWKEVQARTDITLKDETAIPTLLEPRDHHTRPKRRTSSTLTSMSQATLTTLASRLNLTTLSTAPSSSSTTSTPAASASPSSRDIAPATSFHYLPLLTSISNVLSIPRTQLTAGIKARGIWEAARLEPSTNNNDPDNLDDDISTFLTIHNPLPIESMLSASSSHQNSTAQLLLIDLEDLEYMYSHGWCPPTDPIRIPRRLRPLPFHRRGEAPPAADCFLKVIKSARGFGFDFVRWGVMEDEDGVGGDWDGGHMRTERVVEWAFSREVGGKIGKVEREIERMGLN